MRFLLRYILTPGCVLFSVLSFSQVTSVIVEGSVYDTVSLRPIEFASIELVHLPDSVVVKGTVTDKKGKYSIEASSTGSHVLRYSFIGYDIKYTSPFTIGSVSRINMGTTGLHQTIQQISEVVVTSRKQTLVTGIDRKVYNVEQDIMSRSGSASDILKNIPSVEVDVEGQVALRGSGDVMILINGKPSPLMGRSRAEILQQLPANSIERIEVITNPSARYRPDGVSGIINIILKKNIRNGFNGTAVVNAGTRDRYNGNITLNYRPKNLNLFTSYGIRKDARRRFTSIDRVLLDNNGAAEGYYTQSSRSLARPLAHIANAGLDYTIDARNSMGLSGSLFYRRMTRNDEAINLRYDAQRNLLLHADRLRYAPENEKQYNFTGFFQHLFPKEDHELRIEYNSSSSNETDNSYYTNIYRLPTNPTDYDNTILREKEDENQFTIDYSNPLSENMKLQAGYDGLYNTTDLDFYREYFDISQNQFLKDAERTNRFRYREHIHAVYATLEKTWENWGLSAGVRGEQAYTTSNLLTKDSLIRNNYFNLYPTLHLSYALKEGSELQLNYSKRVNRPDADELNPFPEYQDSLNLRAGNPTLQPEIIHSIELGYKWQNKNFSFVPSLYYRYKQNGFTTVTVPLNDSTLLTTQQNLSNDQSAGLELIFSAKAGSWFNTNLSSNIFYNRINSDNLGFIQNRSIISMSATLNSNFTLAKTTILQLSSNYRSARLTPQGKTYATVVLNMGMRQDLFKNKISLTVTASDLFASLRQKTELNTPTLKQTSLNRRDGRIIFIGISYRFGIIKKEKEDEKLQFDNSL
jgi:outer membrane receptor protein involved in Fe transport